MRFRGWVPVLSLCACGQGAGAVDAPLAQFDAATVPDAPLTAPDGAPDASPRSIDGGMLPVADAATAAQPDAQGMPQPDAQGMPQPDAQTVDRCPIEKDDLKVQFPYYSVDPPTVVQTYGYCYKTNGSSISEGPTGATTLDRLVDRTGAVAIDNIAGILWFVDFSIGHEALTGADFEKLAQKTGIPIKAFDAHSVGIQTTSNPASTPDYTLPAGVTLGAFLGSSSSETGTIRFQAMNDSAPLQKVLTDLASGIAVKLRLQPGTGISPLPIYVYTVKLSTGSMKVELVNIEAE